MQAEVYERVRIESEGAVYEGTLMPSQTDRIVLKLKNGYNIGIRKDGASIRVLEKKEHIDIHKPIHLSHEKKKRPAEHLHTFNRWHHCEQNRLQNGRRDIAILGR